MLADICGPMHLLLLDAFSAYIEKLRIQGVRSFGNKTAESIHFDGPLTLIVGYNGSGKTTIIECLKYATMGQLPPNSKSGAFVHDPKLCAEKEVMAQVKLQFRNAAGGKMVITRSLSVTVKKGGITQKTLECQLLMMVNGERTSMSTQVAQLNEIVPQSLGVSPAILESVIFCHQDDSLWPMSEPAALKKKFDNIFEAQKYTKAVDSLKLLRKGRMEQGRLYKQQEEHTKMIKDKAEKVEKRTLDLEKEIEELRTQAAVLKQEMAAAKSIMEEKRAQAHKALGYVERLKTKTERAGYLQDTLDTLRTNMEELQESDEWLQSTLEQYENRMAQYQEQHEQLTSEYVETQENIENSRKLLSAKQAEQGRQQAAKDTYEGQIRSRVALVKEAARTHSMRGFDGDLLEDQVKDFVGRVQKLSREKERELDRIKKAAEDEQSKTQAILDELNTRQSTYTQEKVNARQAITANDKKVLLNQQQADRIKMDEGTKASLVASLNDIQGRIKTLTSDYEVAAWDSTIFAEKSQLQELDSESKRLTNELIQSNKLAKDRAQLEINKDNAKEERDALEIMKSTYANQLSALIGPDWNIGSLEDDYQGVLESRTRALADAKKQQQGLADELSEINLKLKTHRASLAKKKDEKRKCQETVLASITNKDNKPISSIDEYELELEDLRGEQEDFQKEVDGKTYITNYYNKCRDVVNKSNHCRLCKRGFASPGERTSALDKINEEIKKYATQVAEKELEDLTSALKKANSARSQYDMFNTLTNVEIPSIEKDIKKFEDARAPLTKRLEQQDSEVNEKEIAKRDAESLGGKVSKIMAHVAQISKHEENIARLSSQAIFSGGSLSAEEIGEQKSACDERIRVQKAKVEKLQNDRDDAKTNLNNLEREAGTIRQKSSSAQYDLEKKQSYLGVIAELRGHTSQQREIIQRADTALEGLAPQFSMAEVQHADAKQSGRAKEKEVQADKDKLAETVNRFLLIDKAINSYIEEGGPANLATCQRAIMNIEQEIKSNTAELGTIAEKNNEVKKRIDKSDKTKRSIQDNLTYRKSLRELEVEQREIAELSSRNVGDDYRQLDREANEANQRYQEATANRSIVVGAMGSKDQEYRRSIEEWEVDYKDAASKYRESHINVATNVAACDDLAKFTKALDAAIMKYHTIKMQEINAVAGELWRSTYQGTDVDTIMIRSENEKDSSSKRNYNYRVVMMKQDAEMDMRGRCSAGQRVLACIVIRLALAECFGINCGVIALDEPTTNLDADNIKALAISLNQIIKHRKQQKNFQLVIITHDEEFLKHMKCNEFTDTYYRVSRNQEQKSQIEKQPIGEIFAT